TGSIGPLWLASVMLPCPDPVIRPIPDVMVGSAGTSHSRPGRSLWGGVPGEGVWNPQKCHSSTDRYSV
ncbi:MAG: hypothetical protein KAI15_08785, partial [Gammaproteobacteria bacterium]|nr:hypothetical protein [Gammaproteobacteria bacterium]